MKKVKHLLLILFAAALFVACGEQGGKTAQTTNYEVIPLPSEITTAEGNPFTLSSSTKIVYPEGNEKMQRNAEFLAEYLQLSTGIKPATTSASADKNAIVLALGLQSSNTEAYEMTVNQNTITITGASEAGAFYGIQTLRKSVPVDAKSVSFQPVTIKDEPRFGYRGMHLDIARHFQPIDFIKRYIDIIALHNMNKFHWHLTDDQGWRIEIKKYPKLTEIGSKRDGTMIEKQWGVYDNVPHGGFYTQEEIKDVVKYAEERFITIIPEIDMPGHMLGALTAYPELGCTGGPYEVSKEWGVFPDVLCAGQEETYEFVENVLTEVMELFPSEYIHIGGDESPKERWEECPRCQARIKELGLKDDAKHKKEFYLQSYFTERVEKFLNEHGRKLIGWDEILEGTLAPNATVMSWRGIAGGIEAAQLGHDVIMTPNSHLYFDYYQTTDVENEPLAICCLSTVENVYSYEPIPEQLKEGERKHILGAQANLWTEYIKDPKQIEYMVMPRMAALSEVQWTQPEKKDYKAFLDRLSRLILLYDKLGYNYATHIFDIQAKLTTNFQTNALDVEFTTIDDAPIYYTLDGSEPTENSTKYDGAFSVKENAEIKAVAIRDNGKKSRVFKEKVTVSKSTFKPISLLAEPALNYKYSGEGLLVDGLLGSDKNYRTGRWMGFQGTDLVAVIDLLEPAEISKADIRCFVLTGDWIFDASEVFVEMSEDGINFTPVQKLQNPIAKDDHWTEVSTHEVKFPEPITARYFKITVKPSVMPDWHPGKGNRAFIFVDEIALN